MRGKPGRTKGRGTRKVAEEWQRSGRGVAAAEMRGRSVSGNLPHPVTTPFLPPIVRLQILGMRQ